MRGVESSGKSVDEKAEGEQNQPAPQDMGQQLPAGLAAIETGGKGKCHCHANDENERRKDQVSGRPTVPCGMFERGVGGWAIAWVIYQDHQSNGEASKQIEGHQPGGGWRGDCLRSSGVV